MNLASNLGSGVATKFLYDPANRLTNAALKSGATKISEVAFRYDGAGRLLYETQNVTTATSRWIDYEYDAAGRKTKMTYPDDSYIVYGYNANGWLTGISNSDNTPIVIYEYDNAGRRTKRTLENSTFTVYDYDNADQMTSIAHKKNDQNQTVISSYTYGYDDAGQRKYVKRANNKGDVFKYDATDQLTNVLYEATNPDTTPSVWTNEVRYAFDAAGNRTSVEMTNTGTTSYTANELNQYTDVGGNSPGYDDNGNMNNDGVTWLYSYDRENRLTAAEIDLVTTVWYRYDAFNRLISRVKDGTSATRFYYDDQWRVIAEYDGNDALVAKYVFGPEIDEPLRMTRNSTDYYYHAAALGTVTEITLADQTITERYTYDVYGAPKIWDSGGSEISNSQIGNRLLFQGRDRDPDTGLYNYRNRYYSPSMGRFVQVDPTLQGGVNLYTFVDNGPISRTDPTGLFTVPPGGAGTEGFEQLGEQLGKCAGIARKRWNQMKSEKNPKTDADKWYHCVTSCEITRQCGAGVARTLGNLKEWTSKDPKDSAKDQAANSAGRDCGDCKQKKSCEECCEEKGYSH